MGFSRYPHSVSIYLVKPVTPAIFFGMVSRREAFPGAAGSAVA